jgi:pterin-4a-carbinolamine dehydratase
MFRPSSLLRRLTLSSHQPVRISPDRKSITLRLENGQSIIHKLSPTPKIRSEKLEEALAVLLSSPSQDPSSSSASNPRVYTEEWELDPLGDAIHRHISFDEPATCSQAIEKIMEEADKIGHHPHIARSEDGQGSRITVTCTTHQPQGLSGRDMRLATKINQVLSHTDAYVQSMQRAQSNSPDPTQDNTAIWERLLEINRREISQAIESCACGTKATST